MNSIQSIGILIWLVLFGLGSMERCSAEESLAVQFRRPVALVLSKDGKRLATANQRSGTISLLDLQKKKVIGETAIGERLSDVSVTGDVRRLLVTDEAAHQLIAVKFSPTGFEVEKRIAVSPYPVSVRINDEGTYAFVASLWSRTITIINLNAWLDEGDDKFLTTKQQIRLPFSPREMLVVNVVDQKTKIPSLKNPLLKLLVADAFGSKLAVIDPESGQVDSVREIPAHAIRSLRLHPTKSQLVISHQVLSRLAQSTFDDVHWGSLMTNVLRTVDLSDLLDPKADLLTHSVLEYLGGPDRGAGDPAGFVMNPNGLTGLALSGTDELMLLDENNVYGGRVKTEIYPTAVTMGTDGIYAYVLNSLSDSVSIIQLTGPLHAGTISLGPQPDLTSADRGERLFHNAKLSHDGWFSCASCHVQGHTNGLLNDNMTDGTFGTAKRVLTLRGVAETAPYSWTGRFNTLSEQITHSVKSTMQGNPLTDQETSDLEAYIKSLPPPPPLGTEDKLAVARGVAVFEAQNCRNCHTQPLFTSAQIADVGLKDERGTTKFNPPSLRGVSQNAPYFHDGRAKSLEAVFTQFHHQINGDLSPEDLADLIAFLTDL
jgi:cytochrome c peroxidase